MVNMFEVTQDMHFAQIRVGVKFQTGDHAQIFARALRLGFVAAVGGVVIGQGD
jgi:hypothetical protein